MGKTAELSAAKGIELKREIFSLGLIVCAAFMFLSIYDHGVDVRAGNAEYAPNICGAVGKFFGRMSLQYLGLISSYLLAVVVAVWAVSSFFRIYIASWPWKAIGAALLGVGLSVLEWNFHPESPLLSELYPAGGVFGTALGGGLQQAFDSLGTYLISIFCILVGLVLCTEMLISPLLRALLRQGGTAAVETGRRLPSAGGLLSIFRTSPEAKKAKAAAKKKRAQEAKAAAAKKAKAQKEKKSGRGGTAVLAPTPKGVVAVDEDEFDEDELDEEELDEDELDEDEEWEEDEEDEEDEDEDEDEDEELDEDEEEEEDEEDEDEEDEDEEDEDEEDEDEEDGEDEDEEEAAAAPRPKRKINLGGIAEQPALFEIDETQLTLQGCFNLPSVALLSDPAPVSHADGKEELEAVAEKIEQTLASFKIEANVGNIQRGPVITQYEVSLGPGIKVHKIVSLADDLAMALSARSIRVVAPIPGKSAVGIEVPNTKRETVTLKELMASRQYRESDLKLPLMLGKDAAGAPIVEDLAKMPHLLLAGATGSGKSVCINAIILSMLMTRTPDQLKLIMVDPKMVELSTFEDIPHLLTPVITDMKKAPAALEWLVRKMEQRYDLLSKAEVRHVNDYNELDKTERFQRLAPKIGHEDAENAPEHLPFIVIIIDELADLMMTNAKDVESSIIRLCQKSRAVGIHVILATQRPSVDVITGLIKSNLPCRISFRVASRVDSRTILDGSGSERLLGQGDMLFLPPGGSSLERAQSTYVSDKDIKKVVRFLKKEATPQFSTEIEGYLSGEVAAAAAASTPADDLFEQAVQIILESQRGSASLLQRRLGIGYTRASRLMDLMAEQGIVGTFKGSKAREVMMTLEEWEAARA